MTDFEFFQQSELSDISKIRIYDDLAGQNAFFSGLTKKSVSGQYKGFDSPFLINDTLTNAIQYSYGRFKLDGKWYYFFVTDVSQSTQSKTWVAFRLDLWETCRYQFGIILGRGTISRSSMVEPCATPYGPKFMIRVLSKNIGRPHGDLSSVDILFSARRTGENKNYFGYIKGPFTNKEIGYLISGEWLTKLQYDNQNAFDSGDLQAAWFSPALISSFDPYYNHGWKLAGVVEPDVFNGKCMLSKGEDADDGWLQLTALAISEYDLNRFVTDETHTGIITDLDGNIVHQLDFKRTYSSNMIAKLVISMTSAKWVVSYSDGEDRIHFTIPCDGMDYFIDSESEYFARVRQFDIDTRELNNKKNLISGVTGGASNALSGAAAGAMIGSVVPTVGTLVGAGAGALAGALGGIITGGAQYTQESYFNPQEQAIKDSYYHNALDTLSMVGSNFFDFLITGVSTRFGLYYYEYDPDTKQRVEDDIAAFGHYTSRATDSGESFIGAGAKLKGDFIILGSIPESWKAGIQARISSGVHIVKH